MILPEGPIRVWLAMRPVDFRKQHNGLSAVVQTVLGRAPYSGAVFAFRSKRGDRMKILVWDRTGLVMVYKRLEGGGFQCRSRSGRSTSAAPATASRASRRRRRTIWYRAACQARRWWHTPWPRSSSIVGRPDRPCSSPASYLRSAAAPVAQHGAVEIDPLAPPGFGLAVERQVIADHAGRWAGVSLTLKSAINDPERFRKSKTVGPWVGLTPGQDQSCSATSHLKGQRHCR